MIGFGVFLWLAGPRSAFRNHAVPAPAKAHVSVKATPAVVRPRRNTENARPKHEALSSTALFAVHPGQHEFKVLLHKEDGWFDTGIPITADISVYMWCLAIRESDDPHCTNMVEAMIGSSILQPPSLGSNVHMFSFITVPSDNDPRRNLSDKSSQYLTIPEPSTQTLKVRIFGDNGPADLQYMVKVYVRPLDQSQVLTAAQQREQTALAKWERK